MQQFTSPRTRLFRKRRGNLRAILLPALAAGAVYMTLSLFGTPDTQATAPAEMATAPAAILAPAPNVVADARSIDALGNMKAAFNAVPAPATHTYYTQTSSSDISAEKPATAKPRVKASQDVSPTVLQKLAFIQSGIAQLLDAGSDLFVSEKKLEVGKGDTLMELLVRNDVPRSDAYNAIQALSKVYNPRDLNPGHSITVFFHKDPAIADPKFSGLQIEKDKINTVMVSVKGDGHFEVNQETKDIYRSLKGYEGNIDSSLYVSAKSAGVPDSVILDLIKMYSWNVDFQRDIQPGDKFKVMFEEFATQTGDVVSGRNNIVFAQLTLGGREMPFYLYTSKSGDVDYFDATGHSAKKSLMKTPIDGARLSSGFGMRRHPVLGYGKMHKGIDFAAPRGTPIYAAGDGTIEKIGPFSSYGKYIRIRHRKDLQTAYAHLNGFRAGLTTGSRVKQGQIIGYVGTTGRSTGPHLHYELIMNGKQVNPSSVKLPTGKALEGNEKAKFKNVVATRNSEFEKLGQGLAIADATPISTATKQASR